MDIFMVSMKFYINRREKGDLESIRVKYIYLKEKKIFIMAVFKLSQNLIFKNINFDFFASFFLKKKLNRGLLHCEKYIL